MANPIPLNKFLVIAEVLQSGSNPIYKQELDVSTIVLNNTVTNVSEQNQVFSLLLKKDGATNPTHIVKNVLIPPQETFVPIGGEGKIVIEKNDELIYTTPESNSIEIVLSLLENAND